MTFPRDRGVHHEEAVRTEVATLAEREVAFVQGIVHGHQVGADFERAERIA